MSGIKTHKRGALSMCKGPPPALAKNAEIKKKKKNRFQTGFYVSQHVKIIVSCHKNTVITTVYSQQGPPATITAQKLLPVI